ncbi:MAG: hypothetical protein RJA70_3365, partial [Pseudomonadota bacterium]
MLGVRSGRRGSRGTGPLRTVGLLLSFGLTASCAADPEGSATTDEPAPPPELPTGSGMPADDTVAPDVKVDPTAGASGASIVRRLTIEEYTYTVLDVFGVTLDPLQLSLLPPDIRADGFSNLANTQTSFPQHASGFGQLAQSVLGAMDFPSFLAVHAPCMEETTACRSAFVESAGKLTFRRPLDEQEVQDFTLLFDALASRGDAFTAGASGVLSAMLQSPQFLYRLERETAGANGLRGIGSYEMATRLSYMFWSSAPDAALYADAQAGLLDTAEGVSSAAQRLLQDPVKARRASARFVRDWMGLDNISEQPLREEMIGAALAFFDQHVWTEAAPLLNALTSPKVMLTPALAEPYGATPAGQGLQAYDARQLPGRLGLLGQPAVQAAMDRSGSGSMIGRGLFMMRRVFCSPVKLDPPEALRSAIEEFVSSAPKDASPRLLADQRLSRDACLGCHGAFEPLAFAFEPFTSRGAFRLTDAAGNALKTDGWIPAAVSGQAQDVPYKNLEEYAAALVALPVVEECLTRSFMRFAAGRNLELQEEAAVRPLFEAVRAEG